MQHSSHLSQSISQNFSQQPRSQQDESIAAVWVSKKSGIKIFMMRFMKKAPSFFLLL